VCLIPVPAFPRAQCSAHYFSHCTCNSCQWDELLRAMEYSTNSMLTTLNCSCQWTLQMQRPDYTDSKHLYSSGPWLIPNQPSLTQRWQVRCCFRYHKTTPSLRRRQFHASCRSLITCFDNSQVTRCHHGPATDLRLTNCRNSQGLQLPHPGTPTHSAVTVQGRITVTGMCADQQLPRLL